jgi:hypothetical protein
MRTRVAVLALLAISLPRAVLAQDQPEAQTAGQKLGAVVKDAITTALPGVTALMNLIWPKNNNSKAKKEDVQHNLTTARVPLLDSARARLKPVQDVSEELTLVTGYLDHSVEANNEVVHMLGRLGTSANLDSATWHSLAETWGYAKNYLNAIRDKTKDGDLQKISQYELRGHLQNIRNANLKLIPRIDNALSDKDAQALKEALSDLSRSLSGITDAVGMEVADLQAGLQQLVSWATPGGNGKNLMGDSLSTTPTFGFKARLDSLDARLED